MGNLKEGNNEVVPEETGRLGYILVHTGTYWYILVQL
jgi:hypothetical protein